MLKLNFKVEITNNHPLILEDFNKLKLKALIGQKSIISIPGTYFIEPDEDTLNFSSQMIVKNNLERPLPHFIKFDSNTI